MRGDLERFQRVDMEMLVDLRCEAGTNARKHLKEFLRLAFAAQAIELCPAAGLHHLVDGPGNAAPDVRQRDQALEPLLGEDRGGVFPKVADSVRRLAVGHRPEMIGALRFEQLARLLESLGDLVRGEPAL